MMKPWLVAVLMAFACVGLYVGLSAWATQGLLEEGQEEGGLEGILLILTSPAIGSSVYIYPVVALYLITVCGYWLWYNSRRRKSQRWRR